MKKSLKLAAAGLLAALSLVLVSKLPSSATSLAGQTVGNPLAQDASPTVKNLTVTGVLTTGSQNTAGNEIGPMPAVQAVAAQFQVNADACGGIKRISGAAAVTTSSTTTPLPAASATPGCVMDILNVSTNSLTLKGVPGYWRTATTNADVVMPSSASIRVISDGSFWYQTGGSMWTAY